MTIEGFIFIAIAVNMILTVFNVIWTAQLTRSLGNMASLLDEIADALKLLADKL